MKNLQSVIILLQTCLLKYSVLCHIFSSHAGHLSVKDGNSSFESSVPVLLKPNRRDNNKPLVQDLSNFHPQCLLLQGLIDLGTPSLSLEGKMITYQSCRSQDGSVIREGMSMIYINRENEV